MVLCFFAPPHVVGPCINVCVNRSISGGDTRAEPGGIAIFQSLQLYLPQSLAVSLLIRTYPRNFMLICTITNKQHVAEVCCTACCWLGMIAEHKNPFIG